jgi:hypothetical protein
MQKRRLIIGYGVEMRGVLTGLSRGWSRGNALSGLGNKVPHTESSGCPVSGRGGLLRSVHLLTDSRLSGLMGAAQVTRRE